MAFGVKRGEAGVDTSAPKRNIVVGSKYSNDNQVSKFGGPRGPVESALPVG